MLYGFLGMVLGLYLAWYIYPEPPAWVTRLKDRIGEKLKKDDVVDEKEDNKE